MTEHAMNDEEREGDEAKPSQKDDSAPAITGPTFAAAESHIRDLSADIVATIGRAPGEVVRCRRIVGHHYRCNWWAPRSGGDGSRGGSSALAWTAQRVVKSRLLHVTDSADGLIVQIDQTQ